MPSAHEIEAGKAFIRLFLKDDMTSKLSRLLNKTKEELRAYGRSMVAVGAAILSPFGLAVKEASDFQETMSKFGVVFGDRADDVKTWGDTLADQIGRAEGRIAGFLAANQDLFVPLGFDTARAEELSKQVVALTFDLASFNNMADADVQRDLQAALTGSGEVMKKYGVIVSEAAVKQELLNQSIDPRIATNQQKVQARLNIILAGTTAAQGDAARTAGGFANQMKALRGRVTDLAVEIGSALLPQITALVNKATTQIGGIKEWAQANSDAIVSAAKLGAKLVVLGGAMLALSYGIPVVTGAVTALTAATAFFVANPLVASLVALGAVVVALGVALDDARLSAADTTKEMQRLREAGDKARTAHQQQFQRLKQLADQEHRTSEEMEEARSIAGDLEEQYGGLGITVDDTTNSIRGLEKAQTNLIAAMQQHAIQQVKNEMAELELQIRRTQKAMYGAWTTIGHKHARRALGRLTEQYDLTVARLRSLRTGEPGATTGRTGGRAPTAAIGGTLPVEAPDWYANQVMRLAELRTDAIEDALKREMTMVGLRYADEIAEARKAGQDVAIIRERQVQEEANIRKKYADRAAEEEKRKGEELATYENSLRMDLARAEIESKYKGHKREVALLELRRKEALAEAERMGADVGLVNRRFNLERGALGGGAAPAVAPRGVALTATYSAAAARISGYQPGGRGPEEKMAAGVLDLNRKAEELLTLIGQFLAGWKVA